jgi:hypothetical protein
MKKHKDFFSDDYDRFARRAFGEGKAEKVLWRLSGDED